MTAKLGIFLFATLAVVATTRAASIATDSPHYYERLTYNFISTAPREGTFYYNDFNRYQLTYLDSSNQGYSTAFFGHNDGSGGRKDFSGAAVIGQGRGVNGTFSGGAFNNTSLWQGNTDLVRSNNPNDPSYGKAGFDTNDESLLIRVSGEGLPANTTNHTVVTTQNAIHFSHSVNPAVYARFAISTAGYENITLNFDLAAGTNGSANYRFLASGDGGATWSYTQDYYGVGAGEWFNMEFDFSANPEFADTTSFVFQMISISNDGVWESIGGATSTGDGWGVGNLSLYFDRITLSGDAIAVPEPATAAALLGLAAGAAASRRRRRAG
jgi:hypothetical protein